MVGHNRYEICRKLGIRDFPYLIRRGLREEEKIEHAYRLNYKRRQVSREQKQRGMPKD